MSTSYIIKAALEYYDSGRDVISYLLKKTKTEIINTDSELKRSRIKFFENDKLVLETEFEIIGLFYNKFNIWAWAWSLVFLSYPENYLSRELLNYALRLDKRSEYLKLMLTTSRGPVGDIFNLDILLALGSYIVKNKYIYPVIQQVSEKDTIIYYLILIDQNFIEKLSMEK